MSTGPMTPSAIVEMARRETEKYRPAVSARVLRDLQLAQVALWVSRQDPDYTDPARVLERAQWAITTILTEEA